MRDCQNLETRNSKSKSWESGKTKVRTGGRSRQNLGAGQPASLRHTILRKALSVLITATMGRILKLKWNLHCLHSTSSITPCLEFLTSPPCARSVRRTNPSLCPSAGQSCRSSQLPRSSKLSRRSTPPPSQWSSAPPSRRLRHHRQTRHLASRCKSNKHQPWRRRHPNTRCKSRVTRAMATRPCL
jgi:hypothetical protein